MSVLFGLWMLTVIVQPFLSTTVTSSKLVGYFRDGRHI
jgi:hypothetical protein